MHFFLESEKSSWCSVLNKVGSDSIRGLILLQGGRGSNRSRGLSPPGLPHFNRWCHLRTISVLIPATPENISIPATTASITTLYNYCVVVLKCLALSTVLPLLFKRWLVSRLWAWPHSIWRICMKCYKNSDLQLLGQLEIVLWNTFNSTGQSTYLMNTFMCTEWAQVEVVKHEMKY